MKAVVLIRHASAGDRDAWRGDDRERPLDDKGRRQAAALVAELADYDFERILSSPAVRCVETMVPLGARLGIEIEACEELREGATREEALSLLDEAWGSGIALCTHGDVIIELLGTELKKGAAAILAP